jgi:hypothetical protein
MRDKVRVGRFSGRIGKTSLMQVFALYLNRGQYVR